jgi:hypothetical protein
MVSTPHGKRPTVGHGESRHDWWSLLAERIARSARAGAKPPRCFSELTSRLRHDPRRPVGARHRPQGRASRSRPLRGWLSPNGPSGAGGRQRNALAHYPESDSKTARICLRRHWLDPGRPPAGVGDPAAAARAGRRPRCSQCHRPGPGYDTLAPRRFEFVPLWGLAVFFVYALRRVHCPRCGVRVEAIPWADGKHQLTTTYAWFLARWAQRLS